MSIKAIVWLDRFTTSAISLGERAAALILVGIVVLVDAEVVVRALGRRSLHITEEYSAYGMVAIVFLGAGYALLTNTHIRVSVFYERLGPRGQLYLDRLALIIGLLLLTVLLVAFFEFFAATSESGRRSITLSRTPLVYPQGVVLFGVGLFWLSFVLLLVRSFTKGTRINEGKS